MGQHRGDGRAEPSTRQGKHRWTANPDKRIAAVLQRQVHNQRPAPELVRNYKVTVQAAR